MKKKKKKLKLLPVLILLTILGVSGFAIKYFYDDSKLWKITVTYNGGVNIRTDHYYYSSHYGKAQKGSKHKVLETWTGDSKFIWYKIAYDKKKTAWIASSRSEPYVEEINNPKAKELGTDHIDYDAPVVTFTYNPYNITNINSIKYDHIKVTDSSKYEIKHKVYLEKKSKDNPQDQYWLEVTVTDSFGNSKEVVQKITFATNPDKNSVEDFSVLKEKQNKKS